MAQAKKLVPEIKISHVVNKGKCPFLSEVEIILDGTSVATATLGGKYSPEQVLKSLKTPDKRKYTVKNEMLFNTLT